jgi:PKD repeat protein
MAPVELELAREINRVRASQGQSPLEIDIRLVQSAGQHSRYMADEERVGTQLPGEQAPADRMSMQGYASPLGEVVAGAAAASTVAQIVGQWLATADRDVVLSSAARHMGVASAAGASLMYWTVDFGRDAGAAQNGDCTLTSGNGAPVAAFSGPTQSVEGSAVAFDASTSTDPDGDALTFNWNFGDGGTGSGATASHVFADNGAYTVTLTVDDGRGGSASTSRVVTVTNALPLITAMSGPADPREPGTALTVTGSFSDAGRADTHVSRIDWGDGSASAGTVSSSPGAFSGSHNFGAAGTYTVTAVVTDKDGGSATRSVSVVIAAKPPVDANYAVYGGGWIGSHRSKVLFAFSGKRYRGMLLGNAELYQPDTRLSFRASTISGLEVTKNDVRIEGSGWLNGRRGYSFLLTANAADRSQTFRMKVWDSATGKVMYDSQPGEPDDAEPSSRVNGGHIAVVRVRW